MDIESLNRVKTTLERVKKVHFEENIFQVTGMERQEIKHSQTLKWIFSMYDYRILKLFISKVIPDMELSDKLEIHN